MRKRFRSVVWGLGLVLAIGCGGSSGSGGSGTSTATGDTRAGDTAAPSEDTQNMDCLATQCRVDGACVEDGMLDPDNPCQGCQLAVDASAWTPVDGGTCDDGSSCTEGDVCSGGVCQGVGQECNDGDFCTDDLCSLEAGCSFVPNTLPCDDGNACTENDACGGGICGGTQLSCDDQKACTADSCHPVDGCQHAPVLADACLPGIDVTYPMRGATIKGSGDSPTVTIEGFVTSAASSVVALTINGDPVPFDADGSFTHNRAVAVGLNVMTLLATDADGQERKKVQSFFWSTTYRKPGTGTNKTGLVTQAAGLWLSEDVIDDGTRDWEVPQNLGTLAELVIDGLDIGELIPSPASTLSAGVLGSYKVYVKNVEYDSPDVSLVPLPGRIRVYAEVHDLEADFNANRACSWNILSCNGPATIPGDVSVSVIELQADINLSVANHQPVATVSEVKVTIQEDDISINIDTWYGFVVEFIADFFKDDLAEALESEFGASIDSAVGPLLESALTSLSLDQSFSLPSLAEDGSVLYLSLGGDFHSLTTDYSGVAAVLRGAGYAEKKSPHGSPAHRGVPSRVGCGQGAQELVLPKESTLEVSLSDDLVNSLLYAGWRNGLLEFVVPDNMIDVEQLAEQGVTDVHLVVSGMLAPLANDCHEPGNLRLQVGDLRIDASMTVGGLVADLEAWASFDVALEIAAESAVCTDSALFAEGCAESAQCEAEVCAVDSYCCEVGWDASCVSCSKGGLAYSGDSCAGEVTSCQGQLSLALGEMGDVSTELRPLDDTLLPLLPVLETQIETVLLPQIAYYLEINGLVDLKLPVIAIDDNVPGLPPGTSIGVNPISYQRIDGNTVLYGEPY